MAKSDAEWKSRRGSGYRVRQARARPSNTSIRELLTDERYTEAVLRFLVSTGVSKIKAGTFTRR